MIYIMYIWQIAAFVVIALAVKKIISEFKEFYRKGVMSNAGLREEGQTGFNARLSDHLRKTSFKKISSRRQAKHIIKTIS